MSPADRNRGVGVLGARINSSRRAAGLTQAEFARQMLVTTVTVWRWEKGRSVPQPSAVAAMAALFAWEEP